jgi:hypothetical protein
MPATLPECPSAERTARNKRDEVPVLMTSHPPRRGARQHKYILCQLIKSAMKPGEVAQGCDPSYLGGRDQEDQGWRPAPAKSSQDTVLFQE